jgi:sulfotransferase
MKRKFFYISGLPRTGSSLLSNILMQNPSVHAEGRSALCQMMWDMQCSIEGPSREALEANRRVPKTNMSVMQALPDLYYSGVDREIVFDKSRTWTRYANHQMLKRYIGENPKVIVLVRPVDEIVRSFAKLRIDNGWTGDVYTDLIMPGTDPLTASLDGIAHAKFIRDDGFLFVTYKSLVENPAMVLRAIYKHCELDWFAHDFDNVEQKFTEDDAGFGLVGMHNVRQKIGLRANDIVLPTNIQAICDDMTEALYDGLEAI